MPWIRVVAEMVEPGVRALVVGWCREERVASHVVDSVRCALVDGTSGFGAWRAAVDCASPELLRSLSGQGTVMRNQAVQRRIRAGSWRKQRAFGGVSIAIVPRGVRSRCVQAWRTQSSKSVPPPQPAAARQLSVRRSNAAVAAQVDCVVIPGYDSSVSVRGARYGQTRGCVPTCGSVVGGEDRTRGHVLRVQESPEPIHDANGHWCEQC